ncbi:MAG TPA: glycosyltransferase family 25 protein [Alphaproteobacteria bacterium]|nr:glycosyltransferase family 25 protein [Alphaproteobacteria bacterium]HQS94740.1 glycosyltransferase family 25 protein [Alphaproteobacteria bacterium]
MGELGCLCSHFLIWQEVANNNNKAVLVLEDDIVDISEGFQYALNQIIEHLPEESFVHLGVSDPGLYKKGDQVTLECRLGENLKLCEILSSTRGLGTFAYIINGKMAKKLLNSPDFQGPVDVTLLNRTTSHEISMYAAFPLSFHRENNYDQSIIAHM